MGVISTAEIVQSEITLATASTQHTGGSLERTLWGPRAVVTKGNGSRLDQRRPLHFLTGYCRGQ